MTAAELQDAAARARKAGLSWKEAQKAVAAAYGACFLDNGGIDGWVPAAVENTPAPTETMKRATKRKRK